MTRAEIYRRAAERIESGEDSYSCSAVNFVALACYENDSVEATGYSDLFCPIEGDEYWAGTAARELGASGRVLALLFAAAMAKTGDL